MFVRGKIQMPDVSKDTVHCTLRKESYIQNTLKTFAIKFEAYAKVEREEF